MSHSTPSFSKVEPPQIETRQRFKFVLSFISRRMVGFAIIAILGLMTTWVAQFHWMLDLAVHFRLQYLFMVSIGILAALVLRRWRLAVLFLIFLVAYSGPLVSYCWQSEAPLKKPASLTLRFMSFNVLTSNNRTGDVIDHVLVNAPDVVALMEIDDKWARSLRKLESNYPHRKIIPRQDNFGIAIFSKLPWETIDIVSTEPLRLPSFDLTFPAPSGGAPKLRLIATHPIPPTGGDNTAARDKQLTEMASRFNKDTANLMLGDFNLTPWSPRFSEVLRQGNLRDGSKGFGLTPTFTPFPTVMGGIKIDHALVNQHIHVVDFKVGQSAGSDHRSIVIDFQIQD